MTNQTENTNVHASDCHPRTTVSRYISHRNRVEERQLESKLNRMIADNLAKSEHQNDASTMHFIYENGLWCFAGETIGKLGWETDDMEASTRKEALKQAIDFMAYL
jgi:hypothetical protein